MHPPLVEMLSRLIETPSVSSDDPTLDQSNLEVLNLLANWLDDLGFNTSLKTLEGNNQKGNLIATRGSGEGGLVFSGHSDTVPCLESDWSVDPYALTQKDGRFYGLGTCDMKCYFPLALAASAAINAKKLNKPICIAATSDEETGMAGARELVASDFPKADAVIIGEPSNLAPAYTHKGIALVGISIEGEAGHSSDPEAGTNAIDALHGVVHELMQFRNQLRENYTNDAFEVDYPTLNLGCVNAGDAPNRICSHADLLFDIRVLPRMENEAVLDEIRSLISRVADRTDSKISLRTCAPTMPPYETNVQSPLVQHLSKISKRAPTGVAFGTEAPFFQALGMESVVIGPGSVEQAHQADEFVRLDHMKEMQRILEGLIYDYCVDS